MEDFIYYYEQNLSDKCVDWFLRMCKKLQFEDLTEMLLYLTKNLPQSEEVFDKIISQSQFKSRCASKITQWKAVDIDKIKTLLNKTEIFVYINKLTVDMSDEFINVFCSPRVQKQYDEHLIFMCHLNDSLDKLYFFHDYKPSAKSVDVLLELCEGDPKTYDPKTICTVLSQNFNCKFQHTLCV
uniref:Uncharacterized protein n=1 Tax=viral metagenome TaxID=1070528 RepID=A0A6C0KQG7_9ZZZZ